MGNAATMAKPAHAIDNPKQRLLEIIKEKSYLTEGDFKLASGSSSNFFFDLKTTLLDPEGASLAADVILEMLRGEKIDAIGGLELGACPVASAVCVRSYGHQNLRAFYVRKAPKQRGTQKLIEGDSLNPGDRVVVVDDVTTSGGSVMDAVKLVRDAGCTVIKVITIVDREQGAQENFAKQSIPFEPIFTRRDFE